MRFAPIAIFVYRRPGHARRMLESLARNPELSESPVVVFCDGPRTAAERDAVARTREVVRAAAPRHARIVERDMNMGLAASVIAGVTRLCNEHGRVIVLEDDLVLSPAALAYFNRALDRYRDDERVMHVSSYMYPTGAALPDAFFYREATCWGWATWGRAWGKFEPDAARLRDWLSPAERRFEFDVQGSTPFFRMLELQLAGRVDSWAIRWYGTLRMHDGLALHPGRALTSNEGLDGSGAHRDVTTEFAVELAGAPPARLPDTIEESDVAVQAMIAFHRRRRRRRWLALPRALWRRVAG